MIYPRHAPFLRPLNSRCLSTQVSVRRSYLYVPSSSDKMLQKSLSSPSDAVIYDLEDSVSPNAKDSARNRLSTFLNDNSIGNERTAVRVNDVTTPFFQHDMAEILKVPWISTLVLPKINSASDLDKVSSLIQQHRNSSLTPLNLVASIESAKSMWNLGSIAGYRSAGSRISALLFAAEDYCADTSIIRTPDRRELLFTRSQIVIAAKAFGLDAIDMVCVNYKDHDHLKAECLDGRQLGFTGKQAIHPSQVETIQSTFVPTSKEILRAAKILHAMSQAHSSEVQKGAVGLDGEMIDAPMLKQAEKTIAVAKAAKLEIPQAE